MRGLTHMFPRCAVLEVRHRRTPVIVADRPIPLPHTVDGAMPDGSCDSFVSRCAGAYGLLHDSVRRRLVAEQAWPELRCARGAYVRIPSATGTDVDWPLGCRRRPASVLGNRPLLSDDGVWRGVAGG